MGPKTDTDGSRLEQELEDIYTGNGEEDEDAEDEDELDEEDEDEE
jgi:hypothetical protein